MTNDDERNEAPEDPQTLQRELQTQKRLAAELAWKLARLDADSARLVEERDQALKEHAAMVSRFHPIQAERDALMMENAGLRTEIGDLRAEASALRKQIAELLGSTSWRATAVLRRAGAAARRAAGR